jgi:hypothetical protein
MKDSISRMSRKGQDGRKLHILNVRGSEDKRRNQRIRGRGQTDRIRNPEDNMTIDLEEQRTSGPRASADVG